MYFTREDILKIHHGLSKYAVRDSEFPVAKTPINNNDVITMVQEGKNVKIRVIDFLEQLHLISQDDFLNVTVKFDETALSITQAARLVPVRSRKIGLVITFENEQGKWEIWQYNSHNLTQWNNPEAWENVKVPFDSIAVPDEEDLTLVERNERSIVKFKDKDYSPVNYSGLGRKYLRKNVVSVKDPETELMVYKNLLTQGMLNKENTIYIIQYDYDLNGQIIRVPKNCVLDFQGGSFRNGTIVGSDTHINNPSNHVIINVSVTVSGTWINDTVSLDWFGAKGDGVTNDASAIQNALNTMPQYLDGKNKIYKVLPGQVPTSLINREYRGLYITKGIHIENINLILDKTAPFYTDVLLFLLDDNNHCVTLNNVTIEGNGDTASTTTPQSRDGGLELVEFKPSVDNTDSKLNLRVTIADSSFIYAGTDCINFSTRPSGSSIFAEIKGCYFKQNRRAAILFDHGNFIIKNCIIESVQQNCLSQFDNIPSAAIFCEPDVSGCVVDRLLVESTRQIGNATNDFIKIDYSKPITIQDVDIINCSTDNELLAVSSLGIESEGNMRFKTVNISKCSCSNISVGNLIAQADIPVIYEEINISDSVFTKYIILGNLKSNRFIFHNVNHKFFHYDSAQINYCEFIGCTCDAGDSAYSRYVYYPLIRNGLIRDCTINSIESSIYIDAVGSTYSESSNVFVIDGLRTKNPKTIILTTRYKGNLLINNCIFDGDRQEVVIAGDVSIPASIYAINNISNNYDIIKANSLQTVNEFGTVYLNGIGQSVFDKSLGKPKWWTGSKWVDATGADV